MRSSMLLIPIGGKEAHLGPENEILYLVHLLLLLCVFCASAGFVSSSDESFSIVDTGERHCIS